ncbi:hypothetical protein ROZALSC1DRAFT_28065 [Rozella allomycis CSF55]|uniref:Uncharacterized protein n=1 Tax=Rozella allomycis (strain CSF55) TaxID=988480 RepID=A0A075AYR3_ROZAC|nr:hypothetical protein O9G_000449 [Rozella allomycis CSF55]RKP20437.1 hypothetical protein ROZALSC1DRAFT_28065 [Rozella allomycis CSF55]|eukprot:EPZ33674.1 hypothetical protein O9G_000449 [Rozella allomycis CSF55]
MIEELLRETSKEIPYTCITKFLHNTQSLGNLLAKLTSEKLLIEDYYPHKRDFVYDALSRQYIEGYYSSVHKCWCFQSEPVVLSVEDVEKSKEICELINKEFHGFIWFSLFLKRYPILFKTTKYPSLKDLLFMACTSGIIFGGYLKSKNDWFFCTGTVSPDYLKDQLLNESTISTSATSSLLEAVIEECMTELNNMCRKQRFVSFIDLSNRFASNKLNEKIKGCNFKFKKFFYYLVSINKIKMVFDVEWIVYVPPCDFEAPKEKHFKLLETIEKSLPCTYGTLSQSKDLKVFCEDSGFLDLWHGIIELASHDLLNLEFSANDYKIFPYSSKSKETDAKPQLGTKSTTDNELKDTLNQNNQKKESVKDPIEIEQDDKEAEIDTNSAGQKERSQLDYFSDLFFSMKVPSIFGSK